MNYEERRQARIDRLRRRADVAESESKQLEESARRMLDVIPFGQPILVGHHSEKRDRNFRRRMGRRFDRAAEKSREAQELNRKAMAAERNDAISSDDPEAVQKIQERIEALEDLRERIREGSALLRKLIRKHGEDSVAGELMQNSLRAFREDYPEARRHALQSLRIFRTLEVPGYVLRNMGGNIRRLKERLQTLEAGRNQPAQPERQCDGFRVVEDTEDNRVRFLFDQKPSYEVRQVLKGHGFRWAPSVGAWQRMLNDRGRFAAEMVLEALQKRAARGSAS